MIWFHFNKSLIIKGFLGALALFLPIVFAYFEVESKAVFTLLAVIALSPLFIFNKKELFWLGAFSGIIWFYWIGFSLYYFDLLYLFPFLLIFIFFYYGTLFWLIGFLSSRFYPIRIVLAAFIFDYLSPFGFDWLKPEIVLSYSYFGATKPDIILVLSAIALLWQPSKLLKPLSIIVFFIALNIGGSQEYKAPLNIELIRTDVAQDEKWDDRFKERITIQNFGYIDDAIAKKADLVVLPETAFPYFLNLSDEILDALKQRSYETAILTGGLRLDGNTTYNSSYLFKNGEVQVFDKVVTVPFGEKNPLPKFISKIVNDMFFNGADDYKTADKPSDFEVKGVKFRNAICYEATDERLFEGNPKFMIATSNNAWFVPSMEPVMQKILMTHFAKKHKTLIFHSTNSSNLVIIKSY